MSTKPRPIAGAKVGQIYASELPNGKYAACQVVREADEGDGVEILALDWIGDAQPRSLADIALSPAAGAHRLCVERVPPYDFTLVGQAPVVATFETPANAYSGWAAATYSRYLRWRQEREVSEQERAARAAAAGAVTLSIAARCQSQTLDAARTWRLWLGPDQCQPSGPPFALRVDLDQPIAWDELGKLPALSEVIYRGRDPGFAELLRARRLIGRAFWYDHGQDTIDLRGSGVRTLGISAGDGGLKLRIDGVDDLIIDGGGPLEIQDARHGRGITLSLSGAELPREPIAGLQWLRGLCVRGVARADLARLAIYPALQDVTLRGAPGELQSIDALGRLDQLRRLVLHDFYRCDAAAFPDQWPGLDTFEWHGLRKSDAAILRDKLRGVRRVEIRGAKNDAWIRANLDNPFRDWVDDEPRLGKAACNAWRKAFNAARKKDADVESVLRRFVIEMNKLDDRYGFDTIRREETYEAYHALVPDGTDADAADAWFEELREF